MDEDAFRQLPFLEQILTSIIFYQDQYRIVKKEYVLNPDKGITTRMELPIANRSVSDYKEIKVSIIDSLEGSLEAIDEIIRFLYYKSKKNITTHIDVNSLSRTDINPYENAPLKRNLYIAI